MFESCVKKRFNSRGCSCMPIVIALSICLFSHLVVDKDFDESVKIVAYCVFAVLALLYLIFRIAF